MSTIQPGEAEGDQRRLIERWLHAARQDPHRQNITKGNAHTAPASFAQRRLWFLDELTPTGGSFNITQAWMLSGKLDLRLLHESLQKLTHRHAALRTQFVVQDGELAQMLLHLADVPMSYIDVSSRVSQPGQDIDSVTAWIVSQEARRVFDIRCAPLWHVTVLEISEELHILCVCMHHMISDGWSFSIFVRELSATYSGLRNAVTSTLLDLPIDYLDFSTWQVEQVGSEQAREALEYWHHQLAEFNFSGQLMGDHPRPPVQRFLGATTTIALNERTAKDLKQLALKERVTPFVLLLTAYSVLLERYSGSRDFAVGTVVTNRDLQELEGLIGCFINTVPLRVQFSERISFRLLINQVRDAQLGALQYASLPFDLLVESIGVSRDASANPLFQALFAYHQAQPTLELSALHTKAIDVHSGVARFDLTLDVSEGSDGLSARFIYNTDIFTAATVEVLATHYTRLLHQMIEAPEAAVDDVELLDEQETYALLMSISTQPMPSTALHRLFEAQVRRTPQAICVVDEQEAWQFDEVNRRANKISRALRRRGVGADTIVGIRLHRSVHLVLMILAVMKSGAAYLPLDPEQPEERMHLLLADAQAQLVVTDLESKISIDDSRVPVLNWSDLEIYATSESTDDLDVECLPSSLAYVMYTSGSTGHPKGVAITHEAISNHMAWMQHTFLFTSQDRVFQKTPISFDASVWEFFAPLLSGAVLILAHPGGHLDDFYLVRAVREHHITVLQVVPSLLSLLIDQPDFSSCTSLRLVFCGGEALPSEMVRRFRDLLHCELHNLYGPTEATIDAITWRADAHPAPGYVPLGRPISNMRAYVLDSRGRLVPVGVVGELYLAGAGLARGYLHGPALTAQAFLPDPFSNLVGQRMYRTGDLVRCTAAGVLEFHGRADRQIKIRGQYVEPGEIEYVLRTQHGIGDAAVIARDTQFGPELLAFVTADIAELTAAQLATALRAQLPSSMIPSRFIYLERLPTLNNGKTDFAALMSWVPDLAVSVRQHGTDVEERLAEQWREVLGLTEIDFDTDFFALGGHSLQAMRLVARLREWLDVNVPLAQLLESSSIAALAHWISSHPECRVSQDVTHARPNDWIEQLSEEDLDVMLASMLSRKEEENG